MPEAPSAYANLYRSVGFDGTKMLGFVHLYHKLGLTPTEVDLAFFVDRATHTGGVFASGTSANSNEAVAVVAAKVRAEVGGPAQAKPWIVRRSLSKALATVGQHVNRLGRVVVVFIDGVGEIGLTAEERDSWIARGPQRASDVRLSDKRAAGPINVSNDKFYTIIQPAAAITAQKRAACPLWVLNCTNPNTGVRVPAIN